MTSAHPRRIAQASHLTCTKRVFAAANSHGHTDKLGISAQDALVHTVALGPTCSGKSIASLSLICADMVAGMERLVIDPESDLVRDVMARVQAHRRNDVVVINPLDRYLTSRVEPVDRRPPQSSTDCRHILGVLQK